MPDRMLAGESLCLILGRGGRTVARLRVVAGRDLDSHDLGALGSATEVLTSAPGERGDLAQQRDLLERMRSVDELKTVFLATGVARAADTGRCDHRLRAAPRHQLGHPRLRGRAHVRRSRSTAMPSASARWSRTCWTSRASSAGPGW